jgi:hypothetical protein
LPLKPCALHAEKTMADLTFSTYEQRNNLNKEMRIMAVFHFGSLLSVRTTEGYLLKFKDRPGFFILTEYSEVRAAMKSV